MLRISRLYKSSNMFVYVLAIISVIGVAFGQIIFKMSAISLNETGSIFTVKTLLLFSSAMGVYFISSLLWIWILRHTELGKIYPLMSLAFILVPVASYYMFDESFNVQYFLGTSIIVLGVVVTTSS